MSPTRAEWSRGSGLRTRLENSRAFQGAMRDIAGRNRSMRMRLVSVPDSNQSGKKSEEFKLLDYTLIYNKNNTGFRN